MSGRHYNFDKGPRNKSVDGNGVERYNNMIYCGGVLRQGGTADVDRGQMAGL